MSVSPSPRQHAAVIEGRYTIRRKLGSGSLGTVYLAQDEEVGRPVALKIIRTEELISHASRSMQEEFRAIALLGHPQIARAYDFGYTDTGIPYYTREYVQGLPLPPGPPGKEPPAMYLRPLLDLLEALEYLHSHGVLHLDIHAGNLIVADDQQRGSVLIDFGLLRSLETPAFSVRGDSWSTLPPEMLEKRPATAGTDLFLVGRLLQYRLTGRVEGPPSLPREIPGWGTGLTLDLERILFKALQSAQEQRFRSALEFRSALAEALGEAPRGRRFAEPGPPTTGRESELEAIEATLRGAATGSPCLVWLVSRPGLGKTRLLAEARLRAQLRGLRTVEVQFLPDPGPDPLLLRALQRGRHGRRASLEWLEPLDPACGGTPRERAQRAAEAYFRQDEKPLVLLLDDIELADGESGSLVEALVTEALRRRRRGVSGRGLALLLAGSSKPSVQTVPRADHRVVVQCLKPLEATASTELFESLLRPIAVPDSLTRRAVRLARGSPRILSRLAHSLRGYWSGHRAIPEGVRLPTVESSGTGRALRTGAELQTADQEVLEVLAISGRAMTRTELAQVVDISEGGLLAGLRRLEKLELVLGSGRSRTRRYQPAGQSAADRLLEGVPAARIRRVHQALAEYLKRTVDARGRGSRGSRAPFPRDVENLARHLLAAGKREEGCRRAMDAARLLRASHSFERAVRLLEECIPSLRNRRRRLAVVEEVCAILEEIGDHEKGIEVIEPFYHGKHGPLSGADEVRVRRRLGFHYHGAGRPREALRVFEEAQALANPRRDLEDLIFIDSELAEIHIFLGAHDTAEEACRRGLERIAAGGRRTKFRGSMEVLLRASLGHIEMRRLRLNAAREELLKALKLSRNHGRPADRAAILHNLGVTENQLNEFPRARQFFAEAEQILLRIGRQRDVIKICTNQALIEAKLGRKEQAELELEKATEMLRQYPGQRLECFVAYSRGLVAHLHGEVESAVRDLEAATGLAEKLGDLSLRRFAQVYLAEAHLTSGRYRTAQSLLQALSRALAREDAPVLRRMVLCRLLLLETLLARRRRVHATSRALGETPRTDVIYLEAWNDTLLAMAELLSGHDPVPLLERARVVFERLEVTAGIRLVRLLRLVEALQREDHAGIRRELRNLEGASEAASIPLRVAEPLAVAEGYLALGDVNEAVKWLGVSSSAIVGSRFLELDCRLELFRTRVAVRKGELREARRHLHRCLHSRDLLLQFVPDDARQAFTEQPRFEALRECLSRVHVSPALEYSTERLRRSRIYEGMVGQSPAMQELFQALERIRDQELPVLIQGETGTGKELVARAIHNRSPRHRRPLQTVSCACLPPELFESEFFGHAAGAFTGAERDQPGILENAAGGTLLLDEVGLLPPESQSKLLRVLETRTVRRLGSISERPIDVRFIATTGADLSRAVEDGSFRADLYYRLAGIELRVPPLSERREDIALLARHFLEQHAARLDRGVPILEPDAVLFLEQRGWPGNVRELEMFLLRALVNLPDPDRLSARDLERLGPTRRASILPADILSKDLGELREDLEREYLTRLFLKTDGNIPRMLETLEVRSTKLYAWLRDLGLDIRELRRQLGRKRAD